MEKGEKDFDSAVMLLLLEKEKDSANTSYGVHSKKQDRSSCTLYDSFKQEHPKRVNRVALVDPIEAFLIQNRIFLFAFSLFVFWLAWA